MGLHIHYKVMWCGVGVFVGRVPNTVLEPLTALKGSQFYFYLRFLQLLLCCVAAVKSLRIHHP